MTVNSLQWNYLHPLGNEGETVNLTGEEWHHCFHVLRMSEGDRMILTDGMGRCLEGVIRKATKQDGEIELLHDFSFEYKNPRNYRLSIGMAPTKNIDRTEFAIEKMVELGVDEICFLSCQHGERTHIRTDRIGKIVTSACKQSKKIFFPVVREMTTPADYVNQKQIAQSNALVLCCHLDETSKSIAQNYSGGHDVVMLIGPEGGFSPTELEVLTVLKVKMTHLGPFRLRVETAAITACANIHLLNELK